MKKTLFFSLLSSALILGACGKNSSSSDSTSSSLGVSPPSSSSSSASGTRNNSTGTGGATSASGASGSTSGATGSTAPVACDEAGPIGIYNGYVQRDDKTYVPLTLDVEFKKGALAGTTPLRANVRVGFWGGVQIGTDTVDFDWTKNTLSVTFGASGGGSSGSSGSGASSGSSTPSSGSSSGGSSGSTPSVEIRGTLQCGALVNATINGAMSRLQTVVLSKAEKSLFDDSKKQFDYNVTFDGQDTNPSVLTIFPRLGAASSSGFSDFSQIPALTSSIKFMGYGAAVIGFDSTNYDPLRGKLLLTTQGNGYVQCYVSASDLAGNVISPDLNCDVTVGTAVGHTLTGKSVTTATTITARPPSYFKGLFSASDGNVYTAVAELAYQDKNGQNPVDSVFPVFPVLSLKIYVCDFGSSSVLERAVYQSASLNPITSQAVFRFTKSDGSGSEDFDMNVDFDRGFTAFRGVVKSAQGGSGGSPSYSFTALKDQKSWQTCGTK